MYMFLTKSNAYLRCTWWFDIVKWLLQSSQLTYPSHIVTFFVCLMSMLEIYSLSRCPFSVLLNIVIMYIHYLDLFVLRNCNFLPFTNISPFLPLSTPSNHYSTFCFYCSIFFLFLDSTYNWDHNCICLSLSGLVP